MPDAFRKRLRDVAPALTARVDALCERWLGPLEAKLEEAEFRPKQINDAVWGSVELLPWEVALLDSPLLQRMRGVRQLGLAHLVFPGAVHDRLEHIIGVVGAVEAMTSAIGRQIDRWNRDPRNSSRMLPPITDDDRHRLRLAAIFHDLGHGPFSHAIEPVLEVASPLGAPAGPAGGGPDWRSEIGVLRAELKSQYALNSSPSVSEIIAVVIVLSEPVFRVFRSDRLMTKRWAAAAVIQQQIAACVVGAIGGPGADHLSAVISSQLDADRTDYLSRDTHHAGLTIGFDTTRLLSRLEILQMRQDNTPGADAVTRARIAETSPNPVLQLGIAASGFGSFEQMLIGRTFLYDRLYHHHKVRAAEAMAQRMILVAERDRGRRFELDEIFISVGDDTMIRMLAEQVVHPRFETRSDPASRLARGLLDRQLLHRAYAFRSRFVSTPPGIGDLIAESTRNETWRRLLKALETLGQRYEVGAAIHSAAVEIVGVLDAAGLPAIAPYREAMAAIGPEHVIVDVPSRKADAIRIMARYPDGTLKVPEFSFNPVRWADAYDLQKRTGYVFCPREVVPVVALAAGIVFLARFGIVMGTDADGLIKAGGPLNPTWIPALVVARVIDQEAADQLQSLRHSLVLVQQEDLGIPSRWMEEKPHFGSELTGRIKAGLRSGLAFKNLEAFGRTMSAMFAFMDMWYAGDRVSGQVADESELQKILRDHFRSRSLNVQEGAVAGGGRFDLYVEDAVLIENKFKGTPTADPTTAAAGAGIQGRRYAISLLSQIVVTVAAVRVVPGANVPQRSDMVEVHRTADADGNRVEIRFTVPFGAVVPSAEKGR